MPIPFSTTFGTLPSDAILLNYEFAEAYAKRALARVELENYRLGFGWDYSSPVADCDKAVELDPLIELDPKVAKAYVEMGDEYLDKWEFDKALALYTRAIQINPSIEVDSRLLQLHLDRAALNSDLCYDYATFWTPLYDYEVTEKCNSAIADCDKVIELDPNKISIYSTRGFVWQTMSQYYYDLAIDDYSRVVNASPGLSSGYLYRGELYAWLGMRYDELIDQAITDLEAYLSLRLEEPFREYEEARKLQEERIERMRQLIQELESI